MFSKLSEWVQAYTGGAGQNLIGFFVAFVIGIGVRTLMTYFFRDMLIANAKKDLARAQANGTPYVPRCPQMEQTTWMSSFKKYIPKCFSGDSTEPVPVVRPTSLLVDADKKTTGTAAPPNSPASSDCGSGEPAQNTLEDPCFCCGKDLTDPSTSGHHAYKSKSD